MASVGTVVLGAIGSGVWDIAGKPIVQRVGGAVLTAATLGSTAIKDSIYREAARGNHEASSLYLTGLVVVVSILCWVAFVTFTVGGVFLDRIADARFRDSVDRAKRRSDGDPQKANKIVIQEQRAHINKRKRQLKVLGVIELTLVVVAVSISYLKFVQANNATTYYRQALAICGPYVSGDEKQIFEARFASINGRKDYVQLIADMKHIADSKQVKLPSFTPW